MPCTNASQGANDSRRGTHSLTVGPVCEFPMVCGWTIGKKQGTNNRTKEAVTQGSMR